MIPQFSRGYRLFISPLKHSFAKSLLAFETVEIGPRKASLATVVAETMQGGKADEFHSLLAAMRLSSKIGFIGGGNMGHALAKGFIDSGLIDANNILISDLDARILSSAQAIGCRTTSNNGDAFEYCEDGILFLAVKPSHLNDVMSKLKDPIKLGLLVSVLAGVSCVTISAKFPQRHGIPVCRVMPNTPALVGAGAAGVCRGPNCTHQHTMLVSALMQTVGVCVEVAEDQMDAVCGLSASGPAYIFTIIEALSDGAVKMGLPRTIATKLAAATVMGAGKMVLETGKHTGELKDMVTSPGGTTIAGIHAIEETNIRAAMMNAVERATKKSEELGRKAADIH